jgi:uncharacterized protein (DUF1697 family)
MTALTNYVALLRGINVGGKAKVSMPKLKELCNSLGWSNVLTYRQTGNVLFDSLASQKLESSLEAGIAKHFGLTTAVIVRKSAVLKNHLAKTPFALAARNDPSHLVLYLSKRPPLSTAVEQLRSHATAGEHIDQRGEAIWIYFPNGIGGSKLTPSVIDQAVGSATTGRNWNTLTKLDELRS